METCVLPKLDVKVLDARLSGQVPHHATRGSAGLDLRACLDGPLVLQPGQAELVSSYRRKLSMVLN